MSIQDCPKQQNVKCDEGVYWEGATRTGAAELLPPQGLYDRLQPHPGVSLQPSRAYKTHLTLKFDGGVGGLVEDLLAGVVEAVGEALEQDQGEEHHLQSKSSTSRARCTINISIKGKRRKGWTIDIIGSTGVKEGPRGRGKPCENPSLSKIQLYAHFYCKYNIYNEFLLRTCRQTTNRWSSEAESSCHMHFTHAQTRRYQI